MKNIVLLKGDGIGPEIAAQAVKVLSVLGGFNIDEKDFGGCAIDKTGEPLPQSTLKAALSAEAVLLGAVGGPKWDSCPKRPEAGLLGLRAALKAYANLRPAVIYEDLKHISPLKDEIISRGVDIMVVRELTGGIYFGKRGRGTEEGGEYAYDTEKYSAAEIERIARLAFDISLKRNKRVCSVDKANVLESSRLWRSTVQRVAKDYPEVELEHMYVDNASMQLVRAPAQFDVILTSNMFGDILSDEASMLTGSIGMLPSASLGGQTGLYEPIHGSAPDIAGQNIANPIGMVLSVAMMLKYSFNMDNESALLEKAVNMAVSGARTKDICGGGKSVGCEEMGDIIAHNFERLLRGE
ncbi:MAG TPA: 3-isopropylmalate dehydrogenase [Firmicutes bacterium]|nr:3-isopropylmalate dehydrogenase [Bacillota bacterium]